MSETPPPFGEDESKVDTAVTTAAAIDIDLNDDKPSSPDETTTTTTTTNNPATEDAGPNNTTSRLNDDLFFSTISDLEPNSVEVSTAFFF